MPADGPSRIAAQDRPDQEGHPEDSADQAQRTAAFLGREGVADHRAGDREDAACAKALDGPADQKHAEVGR